jgi:LysR family hydrogen peroxide-inducible transcriptional activator
MRWTSFPFSLRQIQYALAVRDHHGFGRAAERCFVSQPALSAQVAELEGVLGITLFDRDQRPVVPTADGARWLTHAEGLVRDAEHLDQLARDASDPLGGTVRLGIIPSIAPFLLPFVTPVLKRRLPRLSTPWVEDKTAALVERLYRGELDGAVLALEASLGDLETAAFARDPFVLVRPPAGTPDGSAVTSSAVASSTMTDALARGTIAPDTIDPSTLLLLDEGHCLRDQIVSACGGTMGDPAFRATSLSTLVQMVSAGLGTTLLPRLCLRAETGRTALSVQLLDPEPARTLGLAWRSGARSPALWKALTAALHEAAGAALG